MNYPEVTDEIKSHMIERNINWKRCQEFISDMFVIGTTGDLRILKINDVQTLQQLWIVKVKYSRGVSYGSFGSRWDDTDTVWFDVPIVDLSM